MTRPAHIWLLFALCLAVLLAAMGWVSVTAWRLDRAQAEARRQAEFEEKVRLALWRMDSALAPLLVQESSRPYFTYNSFYAAERAYNRMFNRLQPGEVLVPSPLLTDVSSNVLLHFQYSPDGVLTSPQVPTGNNRSLAESGYLSGEKISQASARLAQLQQLVRADALRQACTTTLAEPVPVAPPNSFTTANAPQSRQGKILFDNQKQQSLLNSAEWQARSKSYIQSANGNNYDLGGALDRGKVAEGMVKPIWFGDALVLARRVSVEGREYIQGCWLDWPNLKQWLVREVNDILPGADLQPLRADTTDPQGRMLASLPARLLPGPALAGADDGASLMRLALGIAWGCTLVAALAVAGLLSGVVSLSERRGAFVSAVTHELRTPLTTFKLYSEMLAAGMVVDEAKRKSYLTTLCSEANRLGHLVENVLAYARLERGSARTRVERVTLGQLLERVQERLAQRAGQVDMKLVVDSDAGALQTVVQVDVSAVEQILFNLVDNACKYAAPTATEKTIHLEALPDGKFAALRVRDHGQGISAAGARRLFQPFGKSAHEAAHTAPGVGLGLALCRRLSRSMGGDLRLEALVKEGACFVLTLPVSQGENAAGAATIA